MQKAPEPAERSSADPRFTGSEDIFRAALPSAEQQPGRNEKDRIKMTPPDRQDKRDSGDIEGYTSRIHDSSSCPTCTEDFEFLRTTNRPDYSSGPSAIRIVDLFAGGGGLSLGAAEAARRYSRRAVIALAAEWDKSASDVYAANFPGANVFNGDVGMLFDGQLGTSPTIVEQETVRTAGEVDLLLAGPPCQGHSNLNNHTRRNDPRNAYYLRAARAAEVLHPSFVIIENVPAVTHDKENVVEQAMASLRATGYTVAAEVLNLVDFGVPQRRRRHIMLAVQGGLCDPNVVLKGASSCTGHAARTVRWAIGDLAGKESEGGLDSPPRASAENRERMQWLIDNNEFDLPNSRRPKCHRDVEHTYKSMYGRLRPDQPAPTITTGFGSMGQGRFVHPLRPRTITPHEAARLQTLPDFFDLGSDNTRKTWAKVIGNAVPPLLGVHLVSSLLPALPKSSEMVQPLSVAAHNGRKTVVLTTPNLGRAH